MAEHITQQDMDVSTNGHRPESPSTRDAMLRVAVWQESDDEVFIDTFITSLQKEPYSLPLRHPAWQQRFAHIKKHNPTLYKAKLLRAVLIYLGNQQGMQWDREIDVFVYQYDRLMTVPLSSIEPEDVAWLWEPYIPYKKLTLVEGDPEAGKTYLLLALAASVTRGFSLPDQQGKVAPPHGVCGNVIYITAEDGLADTIRKRAERCNADLDRIFVVPNSSMFPDDVQPFSLARPHLLSTAIEERQAKLVILDPLTAFLGADIDMHRANEVRPLMSTLVAMATKHDCAMVAIRHWTKVTGGRAAYRGQGNIDFLAAARSVLAIGESPEEAGLRIMAQSKNSVDTRGVSIVFDIKDTGLEWVGTSTMTADELSAAQPQRHKPQRQNVMEWLRDFLRGGPQQSALIFAAATAVGINDKALRRAKDALGVLATKERHAWFWRLPPSQPWHQPGEPDDDERINFFQGYGES